MTETREKAVSCFTSAAEYMKQPASYFSSPVFAHLRWTTAGEQRNEDARLFCRKALARLDALSMPFYPSVGLMDLRMAQHRYVTGLDPWTPMESPFLDGTALQLLHCVHGDRLPDKCWALFAEIVFDVAKLAQIPILWGGFAEHKAPGLWMVRTAGHVPNGWLQDARTHGSRVRYRFPHQGD